MVYNIDEYEFSAEKINGVISFRGENLSNVNGRMLVAALYNENNSLSNVKLLNISDSKASGEFADNGEKYIKLFIWEDLETLKAIMQEAKTIVLK